MPIKIEQAKQSFYLFLSALKKYFMKKSKSRLLLYASILAISNTAFSQQDTADDDNFIYMLIPYITGTAVVLPTQPPVVRQTPENTKYPPIKVNPNGRPPPQSSPPYGAAQWPNCPNGFCQPF